MAQAAIDEGKREGFTTEERERFSMGVRNRFEIAQLPNIG
jgi:hypothetical protein